MHITRRQTWFDEGEPSISLQEWKQIVADDLELLIFEEGGTAMMLPQNALHGTSGTGAGKSSSKSQTEPF